MSCFFFSRFGIRIENLLAVKASGSEYNGKRFLKFEQLTHVPIQKSLILPELLSDGETQWIDQYHQRVWERVSPKLEEGSLGYSWLERATRPLREGGAVAAKADAAPEVVMNPY